MLFPDPLLNTAAPLSLEARFRGAALPFRIHKSSGIFYAQSVGSPRFLAVFDDAEGLLRSSWNRGNGRDMRAQVHAQLADERLGRALALAEPRSEIGVVRVVWRDENTPAFLIDPRSGEAVAFEPQTPLHTRDIWNERDEFWARRWNNERRDSKSDLNTSFTWLFASIRAREQWGIFWGKGGWDEVESVARTAAVADPDCDLSSPLTIVAPLRYVGQRAREWDADRPLSGRFKRLLKELLERNRAYVSDKNVLRRGAPTPFHFAALPLRAPQLKLEIEAPSAHEQLEARFWMRDWVEENAPSLRRDWARRV